ECSFMERCLLTFRDVSERDRDPPLLLR
ncbi:unnamed protein product, partial [Rotaria socialis]